MAISLNATITGTAPADAEYQHPEGVSIVRLVHQSVGRNGWAAEDFDNWRDVGWKFFCARGSARLEFVVSAMGPQAWMLQVAPASVPGFFGRAFGSKPSASPGDVFELSNIVHRTLADSAYGAFRWRWDGPPNADSDSEPVQGA